MNTERWIGSVINLPSVPCFGVCGNILAVSHLHDFFQTIQYCGKRVWSMLFSLVLYNDNSLSSLCCTFSWFGGTLYRRDCCNCFTIL